MKKVQLLLPLVLLGATAAAVPANADVITYFDFNIQDPSSTTYNFNSNNSVGERASVIQLDPTFATGETADVVVGGTATGTQTNSFTPPPPQNYGLQIYSYPFDQVDLENPTTNDGKYIQFQVSTSGYSDLQLSFARQNVDGGFGYNTLSFSTDGSNFTTVGNTTGDGSIYQAEPFDLSSYSQLNNASNATFRISFFGTQGQDFNASNYIDNIALEGASMATPEPATWAMMLIGVSALMMLRRRKQQEDQSVAVKVEA